MEGRRQRLGRCGDVSAENFDNLPTPYSSLSKVAPRAAASFLAALGLERGLLRGFGGVGEGSGGVVLVPDVAVFDLADCRRGGFSREEPDGLFRISAGSALSLGAGDVVGRLSNLSPPVVMAGEDGWKRNVLAPFVCGRLSGLM